MRVIAGEARGRRLAAPEGRTTRPTSDRVRESLFAILQARTSGSRVLDLYAGSGALGVEALSRGAERATFVERDRRALAVIRKNLDVCGFAERATVLGMDAEAALSALARSGETFDLVFCDPPYRSREAARILPLVPPVLAEGGVLVLEEPARARHDRTGRDEPRGDEHGEAGAAPAESGAASSQRLVLTDRRVYGGTALSFFARAGFTGGGGN